MPYIDELNAFLSCYWLQPSRCHKVLYSLVIAILLTVASTLQAQQDSTSRTLAGLNVLAELEPAKSVFLEIDSCRVKMPAGELKQQFTQVEESLAAGGREWYFRRRRRSQCSCVSSWRTEPTSRRDS